MAVDELNFMLSGKPDYLENGLRICCAPEWNSMGRDTSTSRFFIYGRVLSGKQPCGMALIQQPLDLLQNPQLLPAHADGAFCMRYLHSETLFLLNLHGYSRWSLSQPFCQAELHRPIYIESFH
jgi:hypothetical protein